MGRLLSYTMDSPYGNIDIHLEGQSHAKALAECSKSNTCSIAVVFGKANNKQQMLP